MMFRFIRRQNVFSALSQFCFRKNFTKSKQKIQHASICTVSNRIKVSSTLCNNLRVYSILRRGKKSWTKDDIWALLSWLFVGQGVFLLVGTTTFASVFLLFTNSLQIQEWLTTKIASKMINGMTVELGSVKPNWKNGKIQLSGIKLASKEEESLGHSLYDLLINRMEIEISLKSYLEGRGIIKQCEIDGIAGIVDRRLVKSSSFEGWRYSEQWGDFDIENFTLKNVDLTVQNHHDFRTFDLIIFSASLPRFRKRNILIDILSAKDIVGCLDKSLFSLHSPTDGGMRVLKMHSLNYDFFALASEAGPLAWLSRGKVDIDLEISLPNSHVTEREDKMELFDRLVGRIQQDVLNIDRPRTHSLPSDNLIDDFGFQFNFRFHNLHATAPWNVSPLVRPIIAYINEERPYIPLDCAFKISENELTRTWTLVESGIVDKMAIGIKNSFDELLEDRNKRSRRLKRVGLWSIWSIFRNLKLWTLSSDYLNIPIIVAK